MTCPECRFVDAAKVVAPGGLVSFQADGLRAPLYFVSLVGDDGAVTVNKYGGETVVIPFSEVSHTLRIAQNGVPRQCVVVAADGKPKSYDMIYAARRCSDPYS